MAVSYSIVTLLLLNQELQLYSLKKTHCKTLMFSLEVFDPALIKGWNK